MGARQRGWGDPDAPGYRQKHIVKIRAGGRDLYVRREVAHLFKGFIDEIVRGGYRIDLGPIDDWGYANRDIRGRPGVKSNHSWGLAVDLNARTNPMGSKLKTDMPRWVVDTAQKWGLLWGGTYKTRPDAMHFEFVGRPSDVARYPLHTAPEELTMDDEAKAAFAALSGRLDVIADVVGKTAGEIAVLRSAIKGVADDANGMSWLGERVAEIKADLDAVKEAHGITD